MSKLFVFSRALWAAAIPLVVAIAAFAGVDTENLAEELGKLGTGVALLIASVLGLWSRFKPDGAKLKVGGGTVMVCLIALLAVGCTTVDPDKLKINYGTNEAYNVSGPNIEIDAEGAITCTSPDPIQFPCHAQYAGGWETWEKIITAVGIPFEAVLKIFGRSLGAP